MSAWSDILTGLFGSKTDEHRERHIHMGLWYQYGILCITRPRKEGPPVAYIAELLDGKEQHDRHRKTIW